jgi:hypothetical protein
MMAMRLTSSDGKQQIDFPYDAPAAKVSSWVSSRNLSSSITNSVKPHFKQTKISGNTKTWGLPIFFK